MSVNAQRLRGFMGKEWLQIRRDPSSIVVAVLLPIVLLFMFGYGVSLDAYNQPVAVVFETSAPEARDFLASLRATAYITPRIAANRREATNMLRDGTVKAIIVFPEDFGAQLNGAVTSPEAGAPIQVLVNGTDANTARLLLGYVQGTWATWLMHRQHVNPGPAPPQIAVEFRVWFNEMLESHRSIIPGLVAVIMTLIGALLTSLVIAREWERGTMEALLTTPLTRAELLIGKLVPYFVLGMAGMVVSVVVALTVFQMPFVGSFLLLTLSASLFMLVVLGLGLAISTVTRNQFAASVMGITATMLPAVLLSGFIFDIRSMPHAVQFVTYLLPARYFVDILKTLFLAGNIWAVLLPNMAALAAMAALFITITARATKRTLD